MSSEEIGMPSAEEINERLLLGFLETEGGAEGVVIVGRSVPDDFRTLGLWVSALMSTSLNDAMDAREQVRTAVAALYVAAAELGALDELLDPSSDPALIKLVGQLLDDDSADETIDVD